MQVVPFPRSAGSADGASGRADEKRAAVVASAHAERPATAAGAGRAVATASALPASHIGSASAAADAPRLQRQLADAQQASDYLELTAAQLQALKADLSARLAGLRAQDGKLQAQLQQVANTWRNRSAASGGSLDGQLRFSSPEPATQRFSVRGLDLAALQSGPRETLAIAAGGALGLVSVSVDPELDSTALVQRFDQALAPNGIRVAGDASGALIFSVAESAWPGVRDTLAVRGGGIRFPTGQLHRAKADPEPALVQPDLWQAEEADSASLRRALAQVVQALEHVRQAQASVGRALAVAASQIEQARPLGDARDAAALAEGFQRAAAEPGYSAFSAVAAALVGVSRSRVQSLLALPPLS